MAIAHVQITLRCNTTQFTDALEKVAEETAKAAWEAFQPEEGTIEWYDKYFIDCVDLGSPSTRTDYYRGVMAQLAEWRKEREDHPGGDEALLASLREQWEQNEADTAEFDAQIAEEVAAKKTALQQKYQVADAKEYDRCLHHQTYYHREWGADFIITSNAGTCALCLVCATMPEVQQMLDRDMDSEPFNG